MRLEIPDGIASAVYELEARERRFRAVFESALDAIVIFDDKGRVLEANPAAASLFGVAVAELRGRLLDDFCVNLPPGEPGWVGSQTGRRRELEIVRPDGACRLVESSVTSDFVMGQHVGVVRDITDQRRYERERLRLAERVERSLEIEMRQTHELEAIGRLAGGIAHEFNNLLAVISGFAALLEATVAGNAEGEDSVTEIKRATHRAVKLVHGLLAFSQRETFDVCEVDLHGIIRRSANSLHELFGPQVQVEMRLHASRPWARTDALQIEHALQELAVNAHDAMPDGGTFTIETADAGPDIRLSAHDTGTGMDGVTLERAFEPFFTTKPLGVGTGLGLSTVYGIVVKSGGRVTAESEPSKGTTVHLHLPACGSPADENAGVDAPDAHAPLVGTETILLVEEETHVAVLIESFLARLGYRVIRAASVSEAARIAATQGDRIDLIIEQSTLSPALGPTLLEELKSSRPSMPAILIGHSAEIPGDLMQRAVRLARPFAMADLAATARRLLDEA
jgi:PAS domain S-box-containing protein